MSQKFRFTILTAILSFSLLTTGRGQSSPTPEALGIAAPVQFEGALVTASIPDLHNSLDACQNLLDAVMKESGIELNLKAQLGGLIQDPELKGIPEGSGATLIWDGADWVALLECDQDTAEILALIASEAGVETHVLKGVLLLSQNAAGLETGESSCGGGQKSSVGQ